MIRTGLAVMAMLFGMNGASAQTVESIYTDFDAAQCAMFAPGDPENGVPRQAVCPGYGGYPVLLQSIGDNQSLYFGFPPDGELISRWASFVDTGTAHDVIEWRVRTEGDRRVPLATIQRWFVDVPERESPVEVLVVQKVGLIEAWQGCIVGYVVATGNPNANEAARTIADTFGSAPQCRTIEPVIEEGTVPLPQYMLYGYD